MAQRKKKTKKKAARRRAAQTDLDPLVAEARERGYLTIKDRDVIYNCARNHKERWTDPEEKERAYTFAWLILRRGYDPARMNMEVTVPGRTPSSKADIVLYEDAALAEPYLVVENKKRACTSGEKRQAVEQGFGNANSLRAKHMLFDCGSTSKFYDVAGFPPAERRDNHLGTRDAIKPNYGEPNRFVYIAGGATDIAPVEAPELERRVRRAHSLIWSGGKRDPFTSFDEWSKLLFAKVHDERSTESGDARRFQRGAGESKVQVGIRVRDLFSQARATDPSVFGASEITLPDDKISDVVEVIQEVGLTITNTDALGHAFEHFFASILRGDLGQYFTRRELVRFTVALLEPTDADFIIDPTCGSGGFLLEALLQVWHHIDDNYAGQPDLERRKTDFAYHKLFGIEIHDVLGRVCQTNLIIHKDGHTNIEVSRSALDSTFDNPQIRADESVFTLAVGNPPFGDKVEGDDTDHLGTNTLGAFELATGRNKVMSEFLIIEQSMKFLRPGGRFGMVIPDGMLNNGGEGSLCPRFRRWLLRNATITAIVSLPDHAFRKSGAQNKTSILFFEKFTEAEADEFNAVFADKMVEIERDHEDMGAPEKEEAALRATYHEQDYDLFMAEAGEVGYNTVGATIDANDLYTFDDERVDREDESTIIGQYFAFKDDPDAYGGTELPECMKISICDIFEAHPTYRLDPKFHLFKREELAEPPQGMNPHRLGDVLLRRSEAIKPPEHPDREFTVLTLSQEGTWRLREQGKGKNPPAWFGQYFSSGSHWSIGHTGDLVFSQIDLWKGCVAILPPEYTGSIFTQEFPIYRVDEDEIDPHYLRLMLRSTYLQRAIRAITTGHSNRRRTQPPDFENLTVFLPDTDAQRKIANTVQALEARLRDDRGSLSSALALFDQLTVGELGMAEFLTMANQGVAAQP